MKKIWERIYRDIMEYKWAILMIIFYFAGMRMIFHAFCPLVVIAGLPCPGCGLSRASLFLLSGQPIRSFQMHPMAGIWILFLLYLIWRRYVRASVDLYKASMLLTTLVIITIAIYGYRMAVYFPDNPPLSYTGKNILENLIPGYREFVYGIRRLKG